MGVGELTADEFLRLVPSDAAGSTDAAAAAPRWDRWRSAVGSARRSLRGALLLPMRLARIALAGPAAPAAVPKPPPVRLCPVEPLVPGAPTRAEVSERGAALATALASGRRLVVAAIVDQYTADCLAPECKVVEIRRESWLADLEGSGCDLFLATVAWQEGTAGREGASDGAGAGADAVVEEFSDVLDWCRSNGIPSALWEKGDVGGYRAVAGVAALVDRIFTWDLDAAQRLMADLGHDRVHLLPGAASPRLHSPVPVSQRDRGALLADRLTDGSAQHRRDLEALLAGGSAAGDVEVVHELAPKGAPGPLVPLVTPAIRRLVGRTAGAEQLAREFARHSVVLLASSERSSQTAVDERVFATLMSGTPVVSTYSRGLKELLGGLVPAFDSGEAVGCEVASVIGDRDRTDKLRTMALRTMTADFTYARRLRTIASTLAEVDEPDSRPSVLAVAAVGDPEEADNCAAAAEAQSGVTVGLVAVTDCPEAAAALERRGHRVMTAAEAATATVAEVSGDCRLVAGLAPGDWYGEHYLAGLAAALVVSGVAVATKATRSRWSYGVVAQLEPGSEYERLGDVPVAWSRSAARLEGVGAITVSEVASGISARGLAAVAADRFDYCEAGAGADLAALSAQLPINPGIELGELTLAARELAETWGAGWRPRVIDPACFPVGETRIKGGGRVAAAQVGDRGLLVARQDAKGRAFVPLAGTLPVAQLSRLGRR
ncbi:MAG: hypothetical protein LBT54_00625, partial [Bifidobacteriaceae bacterium]|nr:hypothetical protein [Bifidobacteriaceae bacterium]